MRCIYPPNGIILGIWRGVIIGSRPAWKAGVLETGLGVRVPSSPQKAYSSDRLVCYR